MLIFPLQAYRTLKAILKGRLMLGFSQYEEVLSLSLFLSQPATYSVCTPQIRGVRFVKPTSWT